jgi:hypothetical protein
MESTASEGMSVNKTVAMVLCLSVVRRLNAGTETINIGIPGKSANAYSWKGCPTVKYRVIASRPAPPGAAVAIVGICIGGNPTKQYIMT